MGRYAIDSFAADASVAMDTDYSADWSLATGDSDTLTRLDVVRSVIPDAVRRTHLAAPLPLLQEGHSLRGNIWWEQDCHKGLLLLPPDFLRLVALRMSDWERPVYQVAAPSGGLYDRQASGYAGLRATPRRPLAVLAMTPQGRALEIFGSSSPASIAEGVYIPEPAVLDGRIWVSDRCYRPAVILAAALAAASMGENERAAALHDMAQNILNA